MATSPSDDHNMNDAFSPLSHGGLDALVNDDSSLPGAWLSSPLHGSPSPAIPSLPSSPATFPSPNGQLMPLPHLAEDVTRTQFDLAHRGQAVAMPSHQHIPNPNLDPRNAPRPPSPLQPQSPTRGGAVGANHQPNGTAPAAAEQPAASEPTKTCGLCQENLPIAEFRINQRNAFGTYCLDCNALRSRHKQLRVAQLRDMLAAGQISKSDVQAAVVAAHPDYALPGDASLPATRECHICDFPKPITKFPAFGEMFAAADPPPLLGQPKRGLCCQKCDIAVRKAFHVPIQDLRSAAGAGTLADFMSLAVPRNPNLSRLAEVTPCGICDAPRPIPELKDIPLNAADMAGMAPNGGQAGHGGAGPGGPESNGTAGGGGFLKACVGCRRALRVWQGTLPELRTAIANGALAISHANPNNIPKAYRYAKGLMDTPALVITVTEASSLSQTCGQAFLNAIKSRPPVSDVKLRLGPVAPPAAPRTAPLSMTAPLDARPGEPHATAAVKRRRAVDEEWDEPAQQQQDDDSSGPEGADGTKPCKLCRQRLKLEAFSRDGTGGCAYCGPCDHFRRISTRHGVTMAQLRTLVEAGLGVIFLDELAARVLHSSRKVTNATRKQFSNCRTAFGTAVHGPVPNEAARILKAAFADWKVGQAASSYRLAVDIDAIVAAVYGPDIAVHDAPGAAAPRPGATAVSARPFSHAAAPAYYEPTQPQAKRRAVKSEGYDAGGGGGDVEQDIIAAAREAASGARCSFCERRLALSEFPEAGGGERRCHECLALLRCAAQYSMSKAAVRSALHTGTLDLVLPDRPSHKGVLEKSAHTAPQPAAAAASPSQSAAPAPPAIPTRTADEVYDTYLVPEEEAAAAPQVMQRPANPRTPKLCGLCGEVYRLGFYKWQGGSRWGYCAVCDRLRGRCSRAGINVSGMRSAFERGTMAQLLADKDVTWDPEADVVVAADVVEASWATAAVSMQGDDIPEFLAAVAEGRWGAHAAAAAPVNPPPAAPAEPAAPAAQAVRAPAGPPVARDGHQACVYCGRALSLGERDACGMCVASRQGIVSAGAQSMGQQGALQRNGLPGGGAGVPAPGMYGAAAPAAVHLQPTAGSRHAQGGKRDGGRATAKVSSSRGSHKPQRVRMCEVCCEQKGRSAFKTVTEERDDLPRDCCSECARMVERVARMGLTWEDVQQAIETGTIIQLMEATGYGP